MSPKTFDGVPAGRVEVTPLPNVFFTEVLPEIDDLAEAQVTLHVFYLLYHKKGSPRYVTPEELKSDTILRRGLAQVGQPVEEILAGGLKKAEARGTLLHVVRDGEDMYLFNTSEGRSAVDRLVGGEQPGGKTVRRVAPVVPEPPNVFKLYEQTIGTLTPLVAEELKEAEKEYPPQIIMDAFRIAADNNVRKWAYVRAILEDWTREGKYGTSRRDSKKRGEPHFQGDFVERLKRKEK